MTLLAVLLVFEEPLISCHKPLYWQQLEFIATAHGVSLPALYPLEPQEVRSILAHLVPTGSYEQSLYQKLRLVRHSLLVVNPFGMIHRFGHDYVGIAGVDFDLFLNLGSLQFRYKVGLYSRWDKTANRPIYSPLIEPHYPRHRKHEPIVGYSNVIEVEDFEGWVNLSFQKLSVKIGRIPVRYGPMHHTAVALSAYSLPFNYIYHIKFAHKWLRLFAGLGFSSDVESDSLGQRTRRLQGLATQKVDIFVARNFRVGVFETVLFDPPEWPRLFNPVQIYYVAQRRQRVGGRDNLVGGIDCEWLPSPGIKLYGEFIDDDIVVFKTSGQPSKYAYAVGFYKVWSRSTLRMELAYVSKWTYTHYTFDNAYTLFGVPLGCWAGNDVFNVYMEYNFYVGEDLRIALQCEYLNHGDGDLIHPAEYSIEKGEPPTEIPVEWLILGIRLYWGTKLATAVWYHMGDTNARLRFKLYLRHSFTYRLL